MTLIIISNTLSTLDNSLGFCWFPSVKTIIWTFVFNYWVSHCSLHSHRKWLAKKFGHLHLRPKAYTLVNEALYTFSMWPSFSKGILIYTCIGQGKVRYQRRDRHNPHTNNWLSNDGKLIRLHSFLHLHVLK